MTEISIYPYQGKICYRPAVSRRDTVANITILLPSFRIMSPSKHYERCVDIGSDYIVVKWYESNREVPYLRIYRYENGELRKLASFVGEVSAEAVRALLRQHGIGDDAIDQLLDMLGIPYEPQ